MGKSFEVIWWKDAPDVWMPYAPAITATGKKTIYCAGVNAAPVYHSHPHIPEEFDSIPLDMEGQARIAYENLRKSLESAGATFDDVVVLNRFLTDLTNQDAANKVHGECFPKHKPTTTTVKVAALATDPRCMLEITAIAVID